MSAEQKRKDYAAAMPTELAGSAPFAWRRETLDGFVDDDEVSYESFTACPVITITKTTSTVEGEETELWFAMIEVGTSGDRNNQLGQLWGYPDMASLLEAVHQRVKELLFPTKADSTDTLEKVMNAGAHPYELAAYGTGER